jgi:hypothetical protein
MKKYLLLFAVMFSSLCFGEEIENIAGKKGEKYIRIRVGGSSEGEIKDANDTKYDLQEGIEVMVEAVYRINDKYEIASGIGYQEHGKYDVTDKNTFYSIPLYFSLKYNIFGSPFYTKVLGGFSFNKSRFDISDSYNTNHGYYAGAGFGLEFWNLELEGMYSVNSISFNSRETVGETEVVTDTADILDMRITASVSYKFSL